MPSLNKESKEINKQAIKQAKKTTINRRGECRRRIHALTHSGSKRIPSLTWSGAGGGVGAPNASYNEKNHSRQNSNTK